MLNQTQSSDKFIIINNAKQLEETVLNLDTAILSTHIDTIKKNLSRSHPKVVKIIRAVEKIGIK